MRSSSETIARSTGCSRRCGRCARSSTGMPQRNRTRRFSSRPSPAQRISYAELRSTARALDAELAAQGIAPGEVVSYMLPNGVSAASVFLGAMYGGYVVSPVSLLAQDALVEHTLAHSQTRIVFAAPEFAARLESIAARIGSRAVVRPTSPDDLALSPGTADDPPVALARRFTGDADVHVGDDRNAEGRALVARQPRPRRAGRQRRARVHAVRPRAELAAALPRQRPVHRHDLPARVGRQHRDAAPFQRVAMVAARRALSADMAQRRADDHRLSSQRTGLQRRAEGGLPRRAFRPLGVGAAAARAPSRVRSAIRDLGAGRDGTHRVRFRRVRESARSRRAQDRLAGPSAGNGGTDRRAGRRGAAATASEARSSSAGAT